VAKALPLAKEVLFAKFELRLWLALINLKERLRFGFELRFQLALISKLSASENDLASDSSFAFGLLSSRNFQPQTAASHKTRTSLTLVLVSVLSAPNHSPLSPHTSHLTPHLPLPLTNTHHNTIINSKHIRRATELPDGGSVFLLW
jgi:hypothetical protein